MTEQRPQYGEIATLDEQRKAAGLPPLSDTAPPMAEPTSPAAPAERRPSPVDRFATIALLAYGLVNVVTTALSYLDFTSAMNNVMDVLGIEGEFTNYAQGKLWGTIAAIVLVAGWAATAYLAVRRLRRGRLSWWVPVVGAIVTLFLTSLCAAVPMIGDPAFVAFLSSTGGQ